MLKPKQISRFKSILEQRYRELREVEDALQRIRDGSYGICVDTGLPIEPERLEACPTAKRTARAQEIHERTHAGGSHPTM